MPEIIFKNRHMWEKNRLWDEDRVTTYQTPCDLKCYIDGSTEGKYKKKHFVATCDVCFFLYASVFSFATVYSCVWRNWRGRGQKAGGEDHAPGCHGSAGRKRCAHTSPKHQGNCSACCLCQRLHRSPEVRIILHWGSFFKEFAHVFCYCCSQKCLIYGSFEKKLQWKLICSQDIIGINYSLAFIRMPSFLSFFDSSCCSQGAVAVWRGCERQGHWRVDAPTCSSSLGTGGGVHPAHRQHVWYGCCQQCGKCEATLNLALALVFVQ